MKTISELEDKIWYRFLKVIFFTIFVSVSLVIVGSIYNGNRPEWIKDHIITCNYGNKTSFAAWNEKGILNVREDMSAIPDYTKEIIQKACGISEKEMEDKFDAILNNTDNGKPLFSIVQGEVPTGNMLKAILFSLLGLLVALVVFELIKRVFYYIVLGNFRPKK
jgi:hypothetical protein